MTGVWVLATIIGPVVIQHEKLTETFETAMRCIARKCKLDEDGELFIVTNGETALINAWKAEFNECTMLRCTRHFEENCTEFLKKLGISSSLKEVI